MKIINIKIYNGLNWIDYTLSASKLDLNIENAEGLGSIVQKYTGEVDATHFRSSVTGESSVAFGEAQLIENNRTIHAAGKLNHSQGANSIIGGLGNGRGLLADPELSPLQGSNLLVGGLKNQNIETAEDTGDNVILSGSQNINTDSGNTTINGFWNKNTNSGNSVVGGASNTNTDSPRAEISGHNNQNIGGNNSTVGGNSNVNKAANTIINGDNNQNSGGRDIVGGGFNINNSYDVIIGGYGNQNANKGAIVGGRYNINWSEGAIVGGIYNNPKGMGYLLQLGNGTDKNNRSNAFEVTNTGIARAFGTPQDDNDLVRIKELNALDTEMDAKLDNKVDKIAGDGQNRYVYTIEANGSVSKLKTVGAGALAVTDAYSMLSVPSLSGFINNATNLTYTPKGYVDTSVTLTDAEIEEIFA